MHGTVISFPLNWKSIFTNFSFINLILRSILHKLLIKLIKLCWWFCWIQNQILRNYYEKHLILSWRVKKLWHVKESNKLGCYSVQLDYSWGWGGGLDLVQEYISLSSLRCLPSLNFLLCLQLVKKFVVWVVVLWVA